MRVDKKQFVLYVTTNPLVMPHQPPTDPDRVRIKIIRNGYTPEDLQKLQPFLSITELPDTIEALDTTINIALSNANELKQQDLCALSRLHSLMRVIRGILCCKVKPPEE